MVGGEERKSVLLHCTPGVDSSNSLAKATVGEPEKDNILIWRAVQRESLARQGSKAGKIRVRTGRESDRLRWEPKRRGTWRTDKECHMFIALLKSFPFTNLVKVVSRSSWCALTGHQMSLYGEHMACCLLLVPCALLSIVCPLPSRYPIIVSVAPAVSPSFVSLFSLLVSVVLCWSVVFCCVCVMLTVQTVLSLPACFFASLPTESAPEPVPFREPTESTQETAPFKWWLSAPSRWCPTLMTPPWPPALPFPLWHPCLPILPGPFPLHGPGPPSLPQIRLRPTPHLKMSRGL